MPKGPKISAAVAELIATEAIERRDMNREALAAKLEDMIERMGQPVPVTDTIKQMISKARNAPDPLNDPWTLAASAKSGISPDALPAVLRVWKLCLATDQWFTIRHAKWVGQLYTVMEDINQLVAWTQYYALRERARELTKTEEPFESSTLDARLVMDWWECLTAQAVGKVDAPIIPMDDMVMGLDGFQPVDGDGEKAALMAESFAYWRMTVENSIPDQFNQVQYVLENLSPLGEAGLPDEAAWVYTHWLMYLSKGPKWNELSAKEYVDIVTRLREWIIASKPKYTPKQAGVNLQLVDRFVEGLTNGDVSHLFIEQFSRPLELLKKAGYDG